MRQRKTWQQTPRSASTQRRAEDIYTMNRDGGNPQPAATEYENGDPSAWAEDQNSGKSVDQEYQSGAVKRNEIGLPEFRDDTFNHAGTRPWGKGGQYDNARLAMERKAAACQRVARAVVRSDNKEAIMAVATEFMNLPARSIVVAMKAMDQSSPASLPENARYARSLACAKLAALILSDKAEEEAVFRLGTEFSSIDDGTLKNILSIVATSRVSCDEPKESKETEESKEPKVAAEGEKKEEGEKEEKKEEKEEKKEEEGVLTDADLDKLRNMMREVEAETETGTEPPIEGKGDLQNLFEDKGAAAQGGPEVEISFDDEDEEEGEGEPSAPPPPSAPAVASDAGLAGLFDTEENLAQREIVAAQSNFNSRTASTKGAKKLGQIQAQKKESVDELEGLWDRP